MMYLNNKLSKLRLLNKVIITFFHDLYIFKIFSIYYIRLDHNFIQKIIILLNIVIPEKRNKAIASVIVSDSNNFADSVVGHD